MFAFLKNLFLGGLGATAQGVGRAVATFTGDKVQRENHLHEESMAALAQFAAEFRARANRTWWDSLIDGLNRLPRPAFAFAALTMMTWPIFDPVGFAAAMQAYALVPEWLAYVLLTVIGFFFGVRHLEKRLQFQGPTLAQVRQVLQAQRDIQALAPKEEQPAADAPHMDAAAYERAMADAATPLPNEAILEWNRRRKAASGG